MTTEHIEYSPVPTRPTPEIAAVIQGLLKMTDGLISVHVKDSEHADCISGHLNQEHLQRVAYQWEPEIKTGQETQ